MVKQAESNDDDMLLLPVVSSVVIYIVILFITIRFLAIGLKGKNKAGL